MTSSTAASSGITYRTEPRPGDVAAIREIVSSTGYFYGHEIDVAVELIEERLRDGEASGYFFIFADQEQRGSEARTVGYACYGPIPCTTGSYDLYWIAVHTAAQGGGVGRGLMSRVECEVAATGGQRIYIETSSRPLYLPTRRFYGRCGYVQEAQLSGFYGPGDDKIIYSKAIDPAT